eukprot:3721096-Rhodomonas_salina.2
MIKIDLEDAREIDNLKEFVDQTFKSVVAIAKQLTTPTHADVFIGEKNGKLALAIVDNYALFQEVLSTIQAILSHSHKGKEHIVQKQQMQNEILNLTSNIDNIARIVSFYKQLQQNTQSRLPSEALTLEEFTLKVVELKKFFAKSETDVLQWINPVQELKPSGKESITKIVFGRNANKTSKKFENISIDDYNKVSI